MKYLKNVTTLRLDAAKCIGCKMCMEVCPHNVFSLENKKAELRDSNACMECGACQRNCPTAALTVRPGVGCAYAIIIGKLRRTQPNCGCSNSQSSCCS